LINNRQGGRRRGRGGQGGGRNLGGQPGNRQDNRQRGNAAQLLEKYKSMARDAQLAGDRVQTEYYLQFADHYFRVLGENRSRFEDQNQRRPRDEELESDEGEEELPEGGEEASGENRAEREDRQDHQDRGDRPYRNERFNRQSRPRREERFANEDDSREDREERRPRMNGGDDSLPLDVLPPAIGRPEEEAVEAADEKPVKPRRRTRAPRPADGDDEIAPAA